MYTLHHKKKMIWWREKETMLFTRGLKQILTLRFLYITVTFILKSYSLSCCSSSHTCSTSFWLYILLLEQFLQSHKSKHLSPSLTKEHLRLAHPLATVIHFKFFIFNQPTMIFKSQHNVDCWKSVSRCRLGSTFSKVVQ